MNARSLTLARTTVTGADHPSCAPSGFETETVTRVADTHVPDDVYERVRRHFDESEMVGLTFALVAINGWNRLAISFRMPAGSYQPQGVAASAR